MLFCYSLPDDLYELIRHFLYVLVGLVGLPYENEIFILRPYYWGDDYEKMDAPNFYHKETGFGIFWYKHLGRSLTSNKLIGINDKDIIYKILIECINSVNKYAH